tara:strand:- start:7 stop:1866 length:1860 start_codon:yes stop_codon:yes gene_type:complete
MTKQITEVTQMTGGSEGISLLIDSWRNQISQDQQYREFTQNSIESIKRVQKKNPDYKGIIKWCIDERFLKKHKVRKLCIIDNGEGMTPSEMLLNLNSLGGSTRNNEYYNHGCGAKIAGLAHNREGLIYRSWKNGQGYVAKFMRNEMGRYGAVKIHGRNSHPLPEIEKPDEIKEHGCMVTLLGDSFKQNTTEPVKGNYGTLLKNSRNSKTQWLSAYLNTKFYNVPNNIKISCSRFLETGATEFNTTIKGHEHGLGLDFEKKDEVQLTKTKVKIFYREKASRHEVSNKQHYVTNGQLAIVNQDEVIKLEFSSAGGVNPLPAWGLQCLKKHVALVLIPEGQFKQNIERTDLTHEGMSINEQLNLWKTEFKEAMPQWLKDIEAKKQLEQMEKDNDTETRLKNLSPLFKKERYYNSERGDVDIEEDEKRKASSRKENMGDDPDPNPNPDHDPKDEFGKIDAVFGVEVDRSKYKGKKINVINEYPEVLKTNEGPSPTIGSFEKSNYTIEINVESDLVVELTDYLHKKFNRIMRTVIVDEVFKLIGLSLKQQVAHVHNRMNATEEEIDNALSPMSLTACAANKDFIVDRLKTKFGSKDVKNNFPVNRDEHNFHVKNNPNRFPVFSK